MKLTPSGSYNCTEEGRKGVRRAMMKEKEVETTILQMLRLRRERWRFVMTRKRLVVDIG